MKKVGFLFALIVFTGIILKAQKSYIQVICEPGAKIFLDGGLKGITNSDVGGLIIEDVESGNLLIKIVKDGFNPQQEYINVKKGEVLTYKVKPFIPKIRISEEGNQEQEDINLSVGNLKIQSLPVEIKIEIPSLDISYNKLKDLWKADDVPVGTYRAKFIWKSEYVNYDIEIRNNKGTHIMVNMIKGTVSELSESDYSKVENNNTLTSIYTDEEKETMKKKIKDLEEIKAEIAKSGDSAFIRKAKENAIDKEINRLKEEINK